MPQQDRTKHHSGQTAYHGGLAAEGAVERLYCRAGYELLARRWRGVGGEIDLIFGANGLIVFVEVKKSSTFHAAAIRVSLRQQERIFASATEFVATQPSGQLSEMRFDVALVDANGQIKILENALVGD